MQLSKIPTVTLDVYYKQILETLRISNFADQSFTKKKEECTFLVSIGQFIRMIYFVISDIFRDKAWVTKDSKHENYIELNKPLIESVWTIHTIYLVPFTLQDSQFFVEVFLACPVQSCL